ncbi:MAG: hypothetical protein ACXWDN_20625, partial [Limisphaerales bacterium]
MKQSSYKIFPPLPQPGSVSLNGWWALRAQKRRRKRAMADAGSDPGFVPEDMQLWLQASSLGEGPGDSISNWQDESGNVNDATQGTLSMQPTYQEATFAGKTFPVVRFDTVDDGMETPLVIADGTPFSIFLIWRPSVLTADTSAIISSGSLDWSMGTFGNGMLCYFTNWTAGSAVDTTNFFLFEARIVPDVQPYAVYMNGVQAEIEPNDGSAAPEQVMLGASGSNNYPASCDCAEILIYDRFLSGDEA